jgi:hypothetical protein
MTRMDNSVDTEGTLVATARAVGIGVGTDYQWHEVYITLFQN